MLPKAKIRDIIAVLHGEIIEHYPVDKPYPSGLIGVRRLER